MDSMRLLGIVFAAVSLAPGIATSDDGSRQATRSFRHVVTAISADGSTIAIAEPSVKPNERVLVWSLRTRKMIATVSLPQGLGALKLALSPNGEYLAISGFEQWVLTKLGNRAATTVVSSAHPKLNEKQRYCGSLAFSHDGQLFACGGFGLTVWSTRSGGLIGKLKFRNQRFAQAICFSSTSKSIAIASADPPKKVGDVSNPGFVEVWAWKDRVKEVSFVGHKQPVEAIVLSADGKSLVTGGRSYQPNEKSEIVIWNVKNGHATRRLWAHPIASTGFAFSKDGGYLVSTGVSGGLCVWETKKWDPVWKIERNSRIPAAVSFGASNISFWVVSNARRVEFCEISKQRTRLLPLAR